MKFFLLNPNLLLWLVILVSFLSAQVHAFCSKLENNSWDELVFFLDEAQARGDMWTFLCPFHITGEAACPDPSSDGYLLYTQYLDVYCAYWMDGAADGCIIDCPMKKNHFVIESGSLISMDTMTTRGAKESSIYVKSFSFFKSISSIYEYNGYEHSDTDIALIKDGSTVLSSGGAAVYVEQFALADLENCHFRFNRAQSGGAIQNHGDLQVSGGDFRDNEAQDGGAIYNTGSTTVNQAMFRRNQALQASGSGMGGSIYTKHYLLLGGCTFEHNHADVDGGALYHAEGSVALHFCLWRFNTALGRGPAVSANNALPGNSAGNSQSDQIPGSNVKHIRNEGCGNVVQDGGLLNTCDGVAGTSAGSCYEFSTTCSFTPPTAAPTISEEPTPALSSLMPSTSQSPSAAPSTVPPTQAPTTSPSASPTRIPTVSPTNLPTTSPTKAPTTTAAPTKKNMMRKLRLRN